MKKINYNVFKCPNCGCEQFELLPIQAFMEGLTLTFVCYRCDYLFNLTYEFVTYNITDRNIQFIE